MAWLGDYDEDYIDLNFKFTTRTTAGVPSTLGGSPVISVYKSNGITQTVVGVTLTTDFDGVTGLNNVKIDLSADAFYAVVEDYQIVITTGTVNGVSVVGEVVGEFSIENRFMRGTDAALTTKTGFSLSATGLDLIASTATGMVEIAKAIWDRILTGATHNIATSAGRRLRGIQEFQGYEGGAIWIDTVNGTAGTVDYENGTVENPVDTLADALTLATSLGFTRYEIVNGSTITLAATLTNSVMKGDRWTLALGGQDVGGSHFEGADVSGIGTGTEAHYKNCNMGTCTLSNSHIETSRLSGTLTLSATGEYYIADCHSGIAGAATPVIDMGAAIVNTNLSIRRYSGGIEIQNLNQAGADNFSIEGVGQIVYAASSSGTVNQRGDWKVTNTGGVTIVADDNTTNIAELQSDDIPGLIAALQDLSAAEVLTQVNAALDTAIAELGVAKPTATPTMRTGLMLLYMALRNRLDVDANFKEIHNDALSVIAKKALSDDGTTYREDEMEAGP